MLRSGLRSVFFFFFFFWGGGGGLIIIAFSLSRLRRRTFCPRWRHVARSPFCPPPRPIPRKDAHQREKRRVIKESVTVPYALFRGRHEKGGGKNKGSPPTQLLRPPLLSPPPPLPPLPFRPSLPASSSARASPPTSVVERKSITLTAPLVGKEVPDLKLALPALASLPHLCPLHLLLGLPAGAVLEYVVPHLCPIRAPPALGSRLVSCPLQILAREAVPCL